MDYPQFIALSQKEESICIQRINKIFFFRFLYTMGKVQMTPQEMLWRQRCSQMFVQNSVMKKSFKIDVCTNDDENIIFSLE